MSWLAQLLIAVVIFTSGGAAGIKYHAGVIARRDLAAAEALKSDGIQQRKFNDTQAGQHAGAVATLSTQLGDAREKIVQLSGRECLSADTVGMLNDIGSEPGRAAASEPKGAPQAAASGGGRRFATDRDAATAIAGPTTLR